MKNIDIQKSFEEKYEKGILYLVGTPIGNLEDITYRAIRVLREVDIIAAEDTRQTIKLLNHFDISKQLISYHEHNKETSGKKLLGKLSEGKNIALVSDAGLPAISDPGYDIVKMVIQSNMKVVPIPGPNAALSSLICSGISTENFLFLGFLPKEKNLRKKELERNKNIKETIIIYESPYRIKQTLESIFDIFGNRKISLSRELTKIHEEFIRGLIDEILQYLKENTLKGEITVIIEGIDENTIKKSTEEWWNSLSISDHVKHYIIQGETSKEAIKKVALERNIPKKEVYREFHIISCNNT